MGRNRNRPNRAPSQPASPPPQPAAPLLQSDIKAIAEKIVWTKTFWGIFLLAFLGFNLVADLGIITLVKWGVQSEFNRANQKATNTLNTAIASLGLQTTQRLAAVDAAHSNLNTRTEEEFKHFDLAFQALKTNTSQRIEEANSQVSNQVHFGILAQFKDERIKQTVAEVAATQARGMMQEQIEPILGQFTNRLEAFKAEAVQSISAVETTAKFGILATKAANDDRLAFDELVQLRTNANPVFRSLAVQVVNEVAARLDMESATRNRTYNPWSGITNPTPSTATFEDYLKAYTSSGPVARMFIVHMVYSQERFPLYQRLQFLATVAKTDPSLKAAFQACYCFNDHRKDEQWNMLGLPNHLAWWEKIEPKLRAEYETELAAKAKSNAPKKDETKPQQ